MAIMLLIKKKRQQLPFLLILTSEQNMICVTDNQPKYGERNYDSFSFRTIASISDLIFLTSKREKKSSFLHKEFTDTSVVKHFRVKIIKRTRSFLSRTLTAGSAGHNMGTAVVKSRMRCGVPNI